MTIPDKTNEFAINASNERFWEPPVRRYVLECLAGRGGVRGMSRPNIIVCPGGKLELAMQLILTPMIMKLMDGRRRGRFEGRTR